MKKNVLIFPTDDRLGQISVIEHYNRIGFNVFMPKFGSFGFNWDRIAQWPSLLLQECEVNLDNLIFGEDFFLKQESFPVMKDENLKCTLISESEISSIKIDVFHTLRGAGPYFKQYFHLKMKYFPDAVWISSSSGAYDANPGNLNPKNVALILPANYDDYELNFIKNKFKLFCTDAELKLFGVSPSEKREKSFASFNHNFHIRWPEDFRLFCEMNKALNSHSINVQNYGGNIRGMGADVRYHNGGPTGNYPTLSPPAVLNLISKLSAIVHFKGTDAGGGVFFHALHTHTPMITTQKYVNATSSRKYLIHNYNCLIINNHKEAVDAVLSIANDSALQKKLSLGMKELKDSIFNQDYWNNWNAFVHACLK